LNFNELETLKLFIGYFKKELDLAEIELLNADEALKSAVKPIATAGGNALPGKPGLIYAWEIYPFWYFNLLDSSNNIKKMNIKFLLRWKKFDSYCCFHI